MKIKLVIIGLFTTTIITTSCTDAKIGKIGGIGDEFKIEMVNCDGSVTKSWISTGKVLSEKGSDGYYFIEKKSGKLVEVTGNLVITSN